MPIEDAGLTIGARVAGMLYERLQAKLTKARQDNYDDAVRILAEAGAGIAIGLVAAGLGVSPLSPAVQAVLEDELGTPRFAARSYNLFERILSSTSKRRRQRLASVLMGGPHAVTDPDELDRLDLLVATFLDEDVSLLATLRDAAKRTHVFRIEYEERGLVLFRSDEGWMAMGGGALPPVGKLRETFTFPVNRHAISALESARCIVLGEWFQSEDAGRRPARSVNVTELGHFFLEALAREPISSALRDEAIPSKK